MDLYYIFYNVIFLQYKINHHELELDYHIGVFEMKLQHRNFLNIHYNHSNYPSHHQLVLVDHQLLHILYFDTINVFHNLFLVQLVLEVLCSYHQQDTIVANKFHEAVNILQSNHLLN